MALIEPGPFEKIGLWFKSLWKAHVALTTEPLQTAIMGDKPKSVWTKDLDKERRVEVIAREDDLFTFREIRRVTNGPVTSDITVYESDLYDDLKAITRAVSDYVLKDRQRSLG